jgi:hypothetical protein
VVRQVTVQEGQVHILVKDGDGDDGEVVDLTMTED